MSLVAQQAKEKSPDVRLIIASGGNAGFAAACAAKAVGIQCTVFLPAGLDPHFLDSLKREGAELVTGGKDYSEVLGKAREALAQNEERYVWLHRRVIMEIEIPLASWFRHMVF